MCACWLTRSDGSSASRRVPIGQQQGRQSDPDQNTHRRPTWTFRGRFTWLVTRPKFELVGSRFGSPNSGVFVAFRLHAQLQPRPAGQGDVLDHREIELVDRLRAEPGSVDGNVRMLLRRRMSTPGDEN